MRLQRLYPGTVVKHAVRTILVPAPMTARVGGRPVRDLEVIEWARALLNDVILDRPAAPSEGHR